MKDLYRKLGVNSNCSVLDIKSAMTIRKSSLNSDDIADIEHVLLDPMRRQKYDHVHKTVQCITDLRDQIKIPESSGRDRSRASGFSARKRQATNAPATRGTQQQSGSWVVPAILGLILGGVPVGITFYNALNDKVSKPEIPNQSFSQGYRAPSSSPTLSYQPEPAIETGRLATPATGIMQRYDWTDAVAPLEIRTRRGSGNYYVKISRIVGNRLILSRTAFIRDGGTLETTMPLGNYEIRYAIGEHWYGTERHFGKGTSYAKADDVFSFQETSRGYSGFTIELYRQINGNLETNPLTAEEF